MKRITAILSTIMLAASVSAHAINWGVGLNLGAGGSSSDDLKKEGEHTINNFAPASYEVTEGSLGFDVHALGEDYIADEWLLGVMAGIGAMSGAKLEEKGTIITNYDTTLDVKNSAMVIPITVYFRNKQKDSAWNFYAGLGGDIIKGKVSVDSKSSTTSSSKDYTASKFAPHIATGAEYFFTPNIALGLNLKYLMGAKLDGFENGSNKLVMTQNGQYSDLGEQSTPLAANQSLYSTDYSGLRAGLSLRFYFGGAN